MAYYLELINVLRCYFGREDCIRLFLNGGCYWLANQLHTRIDNSFILINRQKEHCAVEFDGGLFDITGRISKCGYFQATDRNISFMKRNYVPPFDVLSVERYLLKLGMF